MSKVDASFTFIDRIEEIESNIKDRRWQSALALSLTIPDICGGIAYPDIVRRHRDGKIVLDKKGMPSRDVGRQYIEWVNEFAGPFFKKNETDEKPYLNGSRCWQLRCEFLHQNKGFVNEDEGLDVHFHLGINCGCSICDIEEVTVVDGVENIRLDIEQICLRMCLAARKFYDTYNNENAFELYNTPVIDYVEWKNARDIK